MKTVTKPLLILIILAACGASPATSPTETTPFTLVIEAEENLIKAGGEVKVDIALRNSSNHAIQVSLGLTETDYELEVRDSQNTVPPETEYTTKSKGRGHFSNDTIFTLQPGESLPKALLVVTKFYDLTRPGSYSVQVSRGVPNDLGGGTIKSNTLSITITHP